jgi:gliding motility-associated-like protein
MLYSCVLFAQDFSNKGKDFWVGYGSHVAMYNSANGSVNQNGGAQNLVLYFTSDHDATVKVEIPSVGYSREYHVKADSVTVSDTIPKTGFQDARITDEGKSDKGIHISADFAIIAYAHIYDGSVSGATLLFPTTTLGRSYYSINYKQISNNPNSFCYAYVIATEDSTNIEIILSANTATHQKGDTIREQLNRGQVYNIFGKVLTSSSNSSTGEDLTGTLIRSVATATSTCKRIAVFSGSGKISIFNNGSKTADNYIQQALPSSAWGKKYLTVPTSKMPMNIFRVAVSDSNAVVKLNGQNINQTTPLVNNFYYEFQSNQPNAIESDLPIMVAQYITTTNSYGNVNNGNGDPEMIYLSPVEQTINKVTINSTPYKAIIDSLHFANIVIPKGGAASLKIDGVALQNPIVHPGDTNYLYYQARLHAGSHTIQSDSGFNAIAYGYGGVESYGYNAGTSVKDLYQKLTVNNQYGTVKLPATCRGTPFKPSITLPYNPLSLEWNIPEYPNLPIIYNPAYDSSFVVNGKTIYRYSLDRYLTYYKADTTYNIQIKVFNPTADGCSGEQTIDFDLVVYSPPKAALLIESSHCLGDSLKLKDNTVIGPNDRRLYSYNWKLGNSPYVDAKNYTARINTVGNLPIQYYVITDIGCLSDTVQSQVIIDSLPKPNFTFPDIRCLGKQIQLVDSSFSSIASPIINWVWDYGDQKPVDTLYNSNAVQHIFDTTRNYQVKLSVQSTNGCVQSIIKSISVAPNPIAGFTLPEICLSDTFAVFTDTSSIADHSNSFTYLWDFGDAANTSVSNTSVVASPRHAYRSAGNYFVKQIVTSNQGCVTEKIANFTVNGANPRSSFTITDSSGHCSNTDLVLTNLSTVDFGNIGKLIIYWDSVNNPLDTTVDENPSIQKRYSHRYANFHFPDKMQYDLRFTSFSGGTCLDYKQATVQIVPPPSGFTIQSAKNYVCIADTLTLQPVVQGGVPPFNYSWQTDNANASINGNSLLGLSNGFVNISTTITDPYQCIYSYNNHRSFEVKSIPIASLQVNDTSICNGTPVILKGAGASQYKWYKEGMWLANSSFDSLITSTAGIYQLKVNDGFCNSLLSNSINLTAIQIPIYNLSNSSLICKDKSVQISTNAQNARGAHFNWDFGDSTYSSLVNPNNHVYSSSGTYLIKFKFKNDYCPKYDTTIIGDSVHVVNPLNGSTYTMFVLSDVDTLLTNIKADIGYTQYAWQPYTYLSNPFIDHPHFRGLKTTQYTLTRTDPSSQCQVFDQYIIDVSNDVVVSVPKAFTPNKDGLNDILKLEYGAGLKQFNYFKLFNRWGKLIFESNDINIGWDGTFNGRDQEMDAYTYLLDYITFKDEHVNKTGSVILLR